jgi:hypothetical protein
MGSEGARIGVLPSGVMAEGRECAGTCTEGEVRSGMEERVHADTKR